MTIQGDIKAALKGLNPHYDSAKATLEHDKAAKQFSMLLQEPGGLEFIEYIHTFLKDGKMSIYFADKFVGNKEFQWFIEEFYDSGNNGVYNALLFLYHQLWNQDDEEIAKQLFDLSKVIMSSQIIVEPELKACVCRECHSHFIDVTGGNCNKCGADNILKLYEAKINPTAIAVLKNGQFLEIYVKHILHETGIELLGIEQNGRLICNSVQYQVEGEIIDVDVHGITNPIGLMLCECKSSKKIIMNELRKVEDVYLRLTQNITELMGKKVKFPKLFIITGEFDINIPIGSYKRKEWELLDGSKIQNLSEEIKRILREL